MNKTERISLFDDWAKDYDAAVGSYEGAYPFDGYERILDKVVQLADVKAGMHILDLGIGTGNLAARFVQAGCTVLGVDFSAEMLAQTGKKIPQVELVQADLLAAWPAEMQQRPFERIVSAYVFHEFDLESKVKILQRAAGCLAPGGRIIVADIAFLGITARAEAAQRYAEDWDASESYWAADETTQVCEKAGIHTAYEQVSSCGGIFTFTINNMA